MKDFGEISENEEYGILSSECAKRHAHSQLLLSLHGLLVLKHEICFSTRIKPI